MSNVQPDMQIEFRELKRSARRKFDRWLTDKMREDGVLEWNEYVHFSPNDIVDMYVEYLDLSVPKFGIKNWSYRRNHDE